MITNEGKNIVAKYLLGQAPEFASYIAVGVGYNPLDLNAQTSPLDTAYIQNNDYDYSYPPKSLAFEAFRVPIISKGLIKDADGIEKMVFKAQLPVDERYHITELALYPAQYNSLSSTNRSRQLFNFTNTESWIYSNSDGASAVQYVAGSLLIAEDESGSTGINRVAPFTVADSGDSIFEETLRKNRYEVPRFLNKFILAKGNSSSIDGSFNVTNASYALQNKTSTINLGSTLPNDKIKLAFSLLSTESGTPLPDSVRFIIQFMNSSNGKRAVAKIQKNASFFHSYSTGAAGDQTSTETRYKILDILIGDFVVDDGFSWSKIDDVKIYCSVISSGSASADWHIALDGMRIEDNTTQNPLYGMVGIDIIKKYDGYPILKQENSNSYVEYRFGIDV